MRKLLLTLSVLTLSIQLFAQTNLSSQLTLVNQLVQSDHIEPRKLDDKLSSDLFKTFINSLDPEGNYLTSADLKTLEKYRFTLDEEINQTKPVFFNEIFQLYKTKLKFAETTINTIAAKPFDFTKSEFYERKWDTSRAATDKQLADKWYFLLKAEVLNYLEGLAANQLAVKKEISRTEILARENEARTKVRNRYMKGLKELIQHDDELYNSLSALYINSFLACMDPHSSFMDASDKNQYQSQLNSEGYFFGFTLGNTQKGEVSIIHLQPGGPAWTSGEIHKDDVLLKMKWASKEAVDLSGMDASEVSELLDQSNTEKLELTVRKKTGEVQTVVLQKRKLENDENIVKSFVLKGDRNIGYITLPSFYTQWEDASGSSCANDVAKEIIKLKKDSISGLILDLRNNGGGSLQEAIEMAGIFIDEGGICQVNSKETKLVTLKDMNRGVIYSGPLLVMVNGYSASASELLAGSLQDYNRALIVGSKTHGKATGQNIKPLPDTQDPSAKGFVKLTGMKLYRVTGKTIQMQGVEPDVILPDPFQHLDNHEADMEFALRPDTVSRYKYFKPLKELKKSGLQDQSTKRIANPKFNELVNYGFLLDQDMKIDKIPLKWELVEKELKESKSIVNEKILSQPSSFFKVNTNLSDQKFINANEIAREINNRWLERIIQDPYIEESFLIMLDLIKIN